LVFILFTDTNFSYICRQIVSAAEIEPQPHRPIPVVYIVNLWESSLKYLEAEVGKVTLKSNGDEALSEEFLFKCNGNEAFNADKKS
jgi:hypothetical protein